MLKLKNKKKIALVLSGGGVKAAAFHIGVCLALQEKGFKFIGGTHERVEESPHLHDPLAIKTYVGSSAGAFISSILASGHSIENIIESFQMGAGLIKKPVRKTKFKAMSYFDMFSLNAPSFGGMYNYLFKNKSLITGGIETILKNKLKLDGIFTARGIEKYMRKYVLPTNSFSELGVEFFAIATHLNHSRKAVFGPLPTQTKDPEVSYINYAPISDAVAASISLPPVFTPYPIKDLTGDPIYYFDGEIRDTLSTHVASDVGADLVISSYSIQPYHYTPEVGSLSNFGLPIIINQALYQVVEQKIIKSIQARENVRSMINTVAGYFKENGLPPEHAERLVEILAKKANFRREVDYIYIHPQSQNYEMFFVDHFSLNPEILSRIVKIGFKSAINALRKYDV
ncbi:MAG: patatin-like phospholipase family protein [Oligoflexia bacterium]|nr:patatin-like phospholipase family protein [Oligoflexia bacterium]